MTYQEALAARDAALTKFEESNKTLQKDIYNRDLQGTTESLRQAYLAADQQVISLKNTAASELQSVFPNVVGRNINEQDISSYIGSGKSAQDFAASLGKDNTAGKVTMPDGSTITKEEYKATGGVNANQNQTAANIDPAVLAKPGISNLVNSGKEFNETDAKNFAFAKGDTNWQQYLGGIGGNVNPSYIGPTAWADLQKKYTPYQLQQATTNINGNIYWKTGVNISDVPKADPSTTINSDAKKISDIVSGAKKTADKTTKKTGATDESGNPALSGDSATNEATIMDMLTKQFGNTAESVYNDLFNTSEMKTAKSDVNKYKAEIDGYDQQLEELKSDIRSEVEGEASESYITALATVRGEKILKQQRAAQRNYDTAVAVYNGLKENATNLLNVRVQDNNTRYNNLFQMLQLQIQQEGTAFNQELALNQLALQIPEGRSMTINGTTVTGLKENDNLNVVQFTDSSGNTYVIGVDKKTGKQAYKTFIGKTKVAGSGTTEQPVGLDEALYWLSLSKNKDGSYDLGSIPEKYRNSVVKTLAANKNSLPTSQKSAVSQWWDRQKQDVSSGSIWDAINPFD